MTTGHVLVVDDEPDIRRLIQEILEDENFTVSTAENAEQARQSFKQGNIDLVLLDIWMPDTDGISLLKEWSDNGSLTTPVIMMSGHGNIETAVEATRLGAYDFIEKPVSMGKLMITVERAMESRKLLEENIRLKQHLEDTVDFIGKSTVIEKLRQEAEQVASHDTPVLLTGEAGSGNSAIARLIHQNSMRKQAPFIEISPTASSEDAAVKIFGSEKNGRIVAGGLEQAQGGSVLLDEIATLDLDTQQQLLTAMDKQQFLRIGGKSPIPLNARVMAASSHDLHQAVEQGRLLSELYYRLNVVPLHIPALRDHREDVPDLVHYYLDWFVENEHLKYRKFTISALNELRNYSWPGNVRELKNVVQRLLILNSEGDISDEEVRHSLQSSEVVIDSVLPETLFNKPLRHARDLFEKAYFEHHLQQLHGNVSEVAKVAEVERTHLYRKLKNLGINPKQSYD